MRDQIRLGALCWLISAEFFLAQIVAHLAAPGHNLFLHDISLLGISACGVFEVATSGSVEPVCSPLHAVFNAGIILHGALIMLGVWLTRALWRLDGLTTLALSLLALGGAGAMTVGAYAVDDDMLLHIIGAVTAIAAPGLGFVLLARSHWTRTPTLARWTLLVGLIVLLAGLGHALGGLPFGRGTMERLAVWPQTIWFVALGAIAFSAANGRRAMHSRIFAPSLWPPRTGATHGHAITRRHV
jgi:hypothetical membrane protein